MTPPIQRPLPLLTLRLLPSISDRQPSHAGAQALPLLRHFENRINFWEQIFTQDSVNDFVLHHLQNPITIYRVLPVPEKEESRAVIERERTQSVGKYDLREEDRRVVGHRGARSKLCSALGSLGDIWGGRKRTFTKGDCAALAKSFPRDEG